MGRPREWIGKDAVTGPHGSCNHRIKGIVISLKALMEDRSRQIGHPCCMNLTGFGTGFSEWSKSITIRVSPTEEALADQCSARQLLRRTCQVRNFRLCVSLVDSRVCTVPYVVI